MTGWKLCYEFGLEIGEDCCTRCIDAKIPTRSLSYRWCWWVWLRWTRETLKIPAFTCWPSGIQVIADPILGGSSSVISFQIFIESSCSCCQSLKFCGEKQALVLKHYCGGCRRSARGNAQNQRWRCKQPLCLLPVLGRICPGNTTCKIMTVNCHSISGPSLWSLCKALWDA